jgi:predicted transcriptional regulator
MTDKQIKKYLAEARRKGQWIACFYWELKLEKALDNQLLIKKDE